MRLNLPTTKSDGMCLSLTQPLTAFFGCVGARHIPGFVASDVPSVFLVVVSVTLRRTSHPSGSRLMDVSLLRQTSAPGTRRAPENLGSLPCPIVYNAQITWLPRGSNRSGAHGRGVARPPIRWQAICEGLRLGLITWVVVSQLFP